MKTIFSENAPTPAGHYSQAVEHQGLVYISGQLPINPGSEKKPVGSDARSDVGSIGEQTQQVLDNLEAILIAASSNKNQVLKVVVYISDISLWDSVNRVYADFFGNHKPVRSIVPTRELHFGFQIEVDAIAAVIDA